MTPQKHNFPHWFFALYLLLLCWAPLPWGSDSGWALNLLSFSCFCLLALTVPLAFINDIDLAAKLKPYWWPLFLLGFVALWVSLQAIPLPDAVLELLSPATVDFNNLTGSELSTLSWEPGATQSQAVFSWALWTIFMLTVLLVDSPARARLLMSVIVFCGLFQALYGSFMTLSGIEYGFLEPKIRFEGVATGTFVSRNHLAGYLEMSLAVGIGLLVAQLNSKGSQGWRERLRRGIDTLLGPKMRLRIYLALMVIALVLTRSRMGNTAFFISLPLCGFLMMALQRRFHKGAIILFVSLILIDTLIVGQWFGFEEVAERLQQTSAESESRDEVIQDVQPMLQNHWLAGIGVGSFGSAYSLYKSPEVDIFAYLHMHNDYLEFALTLGMIGFIPLALLVLFSLYSSIQTLWKRHDQLAIGLAFAALMGMISLLIHSAVDLNLQIPSNGMLFVILLALACCARKLPREKQG
ncbi:MAG: hypothetical protein CMP91_00435 [Gammaproteobacteria bacterium]|nr:hypothetical protein [Gammaproteobacteria bacterium]|tara:strand:- start:89346 stop:90743 length:1398 start_codon:yes stop_codon:yes gene_type:complete